MSDMNDAIAAFEKSCETLCCDLVVDLNHLVQTLSPENIGVVLWGSGADPQRFTPYSDLDVGILTRASDTGLSFSTELARRWNELTGNKPDLHIGIFSEEAWIDPYWRVSVWLGQPNHHPLRSHVCHALNTKECRREHLLEAVCESLAAQRALNRKKPINLRTHPNGLRAIWQIKFLNRKGLADSPKQNLDWMSALFHQYGMQDAEIQAALRFAQYMRLVRSFSPEDTNIPLKTVRDTHLLKKWRQLSNTFAKEIKHIMKTGISPLHSAFTAICRTQARELGFDVERIISLLAAEQEEKIAVCEHDRDATVVLAWCERSETVLHTIARRYAHHALIVMGLAFNRNTPLSIIRQLIDSPSWLRQRPLFRRRCYFHKSHKQTSLQERRHFWRQMLMCEPSPTLRTALEQALREIET